MPEVTLSVPEAIDRALAAYRAGRFDDAEHLCRAVLRAKPDHFDALHLAAVAQSRRGRHLEALADYDRALQFQPDNPEALHNRGNCLKELKRLDEALASYDRAVALRPDHAEALNSRGTCLRELGRVDEAMAGYDRALALRPDYAEALSNRGNCLKELKRLAEALADYERAIALRPDFAEAHYGQALCRLLLGDFDRGWTEHEWRWGTDQFRGTQRNFRQPLWRGEDIGGKTILLHGEQGLGDTIQFCRYVPLIRARGAQVILEVARPLQTLMAGLAGARQIIAKGEPLPDFDWHCPLLSLPLAFGTRLKTIPAATPYLHASAVAAKHWFEQLGRTKRPLVGLAWSGNPRLKNDRNRSIALRELLPLLDSGATFVSLQKDVREADAAVLRERGDLQHFGDRLTDFSDTAALISCLDLVISVDTSVAHLAGAMAMPTWILLPHVPDWRWLLDRGDSPWYPSARLFRQDRTRQWDGVIGRLKDALVSFAASQT